MRYTFSAYRFYGTIAKPIETIHCKTMKEAKIWAQLAKQDARINECQISDSTKEYPYNIVLTEKW